MTLLHDLRSKSAKIAQLRTSLDQIKWFEQKRNHDLEANNVVTRLFDKRTDNAQAPYDAIVEALDKLRAELTSLVENDSLSLNTLVQFIVHAVKTLSESIRQFDLEGGFAKESVLMALDDFYTHVIAPLDIPYVPNWLEYRFVDPVVGSWWHDAASALYDAINDLVNGGNVDA